MPTVKEIPVRSLGWEDPLGKKMATHCSVLAWRIHGQRSLVGYSPWHLKELDTTEAAEHGRRTALLGAEEGLTCLWEVDDPVVGKDKPKR